MNACPLNKNDLVEMDMVMRELTRKLMHGKQSSDGSLNLS